MEYYKAEIETEVKKLVLIKQAKIKYPTRKPSLVIQPQPIHYRTLDKTLCKYCICFKKEAPYVEPVSPRSLYELAAAVVDALPLPHAFTWSVEDVANWISNDVGLPQYEECITVNNIDGMRLILLEDPSILTKINIHYFDHMKIITANIRSLYGLDFIRFSRSHGLPPRRPLIHTVIFKSLTGPREGIRHNWSRTDVLRSMKILDPEPRIMNHWELVWYQTPDCPKTKFGTTEPSDSREKIPRFVPKRSECREYLMPRKFSLREEVEPTMIWMEHRPVSHRPNLFKEEKTKKKLIQQGVKRKEFTRFDRKPIKLDGLPSKQYILAQRQMPKQKFMKPQFC